MRLVSVDSKALLQARASAVLALDERIFTSGVMLQAIEPENLVGRQFAIGARGVYGVVRSEGATQEKDLIAVVTVAGPLAQRGFDTLCGYVDGYDRLAARFRAALTDSRVGAVVLAIDSPGGDVAGLEEAVTSMRADRDASGKRVIVYVDELAASAAYWIASGVGHEVYAPRSALVGSIGCIGAVVDETKALEKEGLKVTLVREPAGKAEGNSLGPVTELAEERTRTIVSAAAGRFYDAVAEFRGLKSKDAKGLNGAVLLAPAAVDAKLIDGVDSKESVLQRAAAAIEERKTMKDEESKQAAAKAAEESAAKVKAEEQAKVFALMVSSTGKDTSDAIAGVEGARAADRKRAAATDKALAAAGIVVSYDAEADVATIVDTKRAADEKTTLIASLERDKKLAKTQVAWAQSLSLEGLKAYAEVAQPFSAGDSIKDNKGDALPVDAELESELKRLNMTREDYLKTKAEMKAAGLD